MLRKRKIGLKNLKFQKIKQKKPHTMHTQAKLPPTDGSLEGR
jgi:hypothetical protein